MWVLLPPCGYEMRSFENRKTKKIAQRINVIKIAIFLKDETV